LSFLIRFIVFVIILWVVRALLSTFLRKKARPGQPDRGSAESGLTVKDPVCGMYMDPRLAIRSGDLYFCSEECRRRHGQTSSK
jgi:hypothetical protein